MVRPKADSLDEGDYSVVTTRELPMLLATWYSGEEAGNAIVDVLFGNANFSGKLPIMFFKSTE